MTVRATVLKRNFAVVHSSGLYCIFAPCIDRAYSSSPHFPILMSENTTAKLGIDSISLISIGDNTYYLLPSEILSVSRYKRGGGGSGTAGPKNPNELSDSI